MITYNDNENMGDIEKTELVSNGTRIGLYDSGLGGLTILKAVAKELPEYDYLYYGDTEHLPLGDKPESEIYEYTKAGVEYLFQHDCALVILACNTASSETLRRLQDEYLPDAYPDRRILGVIVPVVEEVIESQCTRVKLLATQRTVSSGKYHLELGKRNELDTKIEAVATPELVPLIESGKIAEALALAGQVIGGVDDAGDLDGVILGCTHYTLLKDELRALYGDTLKVFSQDEIIPGKLKIYLEKHTEIKDKLSRGGTRNIYLTKHKEDYDKFAARLLEGRFLSE